MSVVIRLAIVDPNDATRELLRSSLAGLDTCWLEAECSRYEFFIDVVQQSPPDAVIITIDSEPDRAIQLIQQLSIQHPDIDIVAASTRSDSNYILQAFRSGAKEFLAIPLNFEELISSLDRLRTARSGKGVGNTHHSRTVSFVGARGGSGSTSIAVNVGCSLAQNPKNSVVLIDLDFALGDSDVCLDIVPEYTFYDVAQSIDRIDLQFLKKSLTKHSSGLYLLPHPVEIQQGYVIAPEHVHRVIQLMKMSFTHVLIDCSKSYLQTDFAAMQLSDSIVMVSQMDISSVRNVVRLLMCLGEHEGFRERVKIVANRVGSNESEIPNQRAEETIGKPIVARVPNDTKTMMAARNNGLPIAEVAPKSKIHQAILQVSEVVAGEPVDIEKPKERKGFFFFGGKT
jgi:pilus assembly protein CpaE